MSRSPLSLLLLLLLLLPACIIDFDVDLQDSQEESEFLVIDGLLSNSMKERMIRISYQDGRGAITYPQVSGQIYQEEEFWSDLEIADFGLSVPADLFFMEGSSYHIEILVEDSLRYASRPQLIRPPLHTDSMSFQLDRRIGGVNIQGVPKEELFIDIYAHVNMADVSEQQEYYYWNADEAWSFTEIAEPNNPNDTINVCYPALPISVHPTTLLSNNQVTAGHASMRIATRPVDETFREQHYFNAYLRSLDATTFLYFQEANRIIEGTGGVFEQIPGTLLGNVYNPDDPSERVFGHVAFALIDTLHFPIFRTDLSVSIHDPCNAENVETNPRKCFDCKVAFGSLSLVKPPYWQ